MKANKHRRTVRVGRGRLTAKSWHYRVTSKYDSYGAIPALPAMLLYSETGLMYARARMYSPGLGRFISRDEMSYELARDLSRNGYMLAAAYYFYMWPTALNGYQNGFNLFAAVFTPNGVDPSGRWFPWIPAIIAVAVVALIIYELDGFSKKGEDNKKKNTDPASGSLNQEGKEQLAKDAAETGRLIGGPPAPQTKVKLLKKIFVLVKKEVIDECGNKKEIEEEEERWVDEDGNEVEPPKDNGGGNVRK